MYSNSCFSVNYIYVLGNYTNRYSKYLFTIIYYKIFLFLSFLFFKTGTSRSKSFRKIQLVSRNIFDYYRFHTHCVKKIGVFFPRLISYKYAR